MATHPRNDRRSFRDRTGQPPKCVRNQARQEMGGYLTRSANPLVATVHLPPIVKRKNFTRVMARRTDRQHTKPSGISPTIQSNVPNHRLITLHRHWEKGRPTSTETATPRATAATSASAISLSVSQKAYTSIEVCSSSSSSLRWVAPERG